MPIVLYQRDDCPLCDQALDVLATARIPDFETVWIDGDPALEARYGTRVPVLHVAGRDDDLGWPFDAAGVRDYLGGA
ncbi:glutaredoxin family protein [Coralloluteibacterium thermophilus]|uniref:Glutaredoxin family protein n=1 Tax=Coralloluteibacterium thermophilum TaxID=2707049 RepID=A0ABV9NLU2_9GAMM